MSSKYLVVAAITLLFMLFGCIDNGGEPKDITNEGVFFADVYEDLKSSYPVYSKIAVDLKNRRWIYDMGGYLLYMYINGTLYRTFCVSGLGCVSSEYNSSFSDSISQAHAMAPYFLMFAEYYRLEDPKSYNQFLELIEENEDGTFTLKPEGGNIEITGKKFGDYYLSTSVYYNHSSRSNHYHDHYVYNVTPKTQEDFDNLVKEKLKYFYAHK